MIDLTNHSEVVPLDSMSWLVVRTGGAVADRHILTSQIAADVGAEKICEIGEGTVDVVGGFRRNPHRHVIIVPAQTSCNRLR